MGIETVVRFVLSLLIFVVCGCELFSTRDPEPPTGLSVGGWQFPREPEIVIDNLAASIGRRSTVDYLKSFTGDELNLPEMVFEADPTTVANYPGLFDSWGISLETTHIQSLLSNSNLPLDSLAVVAFDLNGQDAVRVLGDSAWVNTVYELSLGHLRAEAPRRMAGQTEFKLLRADDGAWYIYRWSDLRISGEPCWSDLKARF